MTHPLDHDGDGKPGGSLPKAKRGRPPKQVAEASEGSLTVKKADAIFDGAGGFLPVGAKFDAACEVSAQMLVERGLAE